MVYTVYVTLTLGNQPPITVDQPNLQAKFGTDTICWVPANGQSGWIFKDIVFNPAGAFSDKTITNEMVQVTDTNDTAGLQTIPYTIYVEQSGMPYRSDPYVLNEPE